MGKTISKGKTFGVTETVTNTKLHTLVDEAIITKVTDADNDTGIDTELTSDVDEINLTCAGVVQVKVTDGTIEPITDDDVDLGSSSKEFKDLHLDGVANIDSVVADKLDGIIGSDTARAGLFSTIEATGLITVTGGQLKFPSTAVPSADPNTIDDYEEGEFEPTVICSTSGGYNLTAGQDTLAYTKTGRGVHIQGLIDVASENSPDGVLRLSLPFVIATLTDRAGWSNVPFALREHGDAALENPFFELVSGNSYFAFVNMVDNGTLESITHLRVDTAFTIFVNVTYITN